jgi:hypothetical protein
LEIVMANVRVIQRHAHLAGVVKLEFVNGREGKIGARFGDEQAVVVEGGHGVAGDSGARESVGDPRQEAHGIQRRVDGQGDQPAREDVGKGGGLRLALADDGREPSASRKVQIGSRPPGRQKSLKVAMQPRFPKYGKYGKTG